MILTSPSRSLTYVATRDCPGDFYSVLREIGVTMLPAVVMGDLVRHLAGVRSQHEDDLARGAGWVELPTALTRKYPNAGRE